MDANTILEAWDEQEIGELVQTGAGSDVNARRVFGQILGAVSTLIMGQVLKNFALGVNMEIGSKRTVAG